MSIVVATEQTTLAACRAVTVVYGKAAAQVRALSDVDLEIAAGETLALLGRSGSGKTTLLHVLGGLVEPTSGEVTWEGRPLTSLDTSTRGRLRRTGIAYVLQGGALLPNFTAFENVSFAVFTSRGDPDALLSPASLLELVGLSAKADHLPAELSGGEQQRVAIARALGQRARLLLCDEPTGQLDSDTADRVLDLMEVLQEEFGFTLVVATHNRDVAARYGREVELLDGRIARGDHQ